MMDPDRTRTRRRLILAAAIGLFLFAIFFVLPPQIQRINRFSERPVHAIDAEVLAFHDSLIIVDLHCDALLWNRDLTHQSERGHLDFPRMRQGNLGLQAFTIVSKMPFGLDPSNIADTWDEITALVFVQRWPFATWYSLFHRAVHQADKLYQASSREQGNFMLIKSVADLDKFLMARQRDRSVIAGFLGIEGAQVLEGNITNLSALFDAGFRMMAPTHFFDNQVAGSAHGTRKYGLTGLGEVMISQMQGKGMIIDLAHASPATIDDVLALVEGPVLVSHSGVRGVCDNVRNLADRHVRGIAATGGVIGVGFWPTATCGEDVAAIARSMRYVADLVGVEHVALGSDFDGAIASPIDAAEMAYLTEALLNEGFNRDQVRLIMGENALRVLRAVLPAD